MKKIFGSLALFAMIANAQQGFLAQMPSDEDNQEEQEVKVEKVEQEAKPSTLEAKASIIKEAKNKSGFILGVEGNFGETTLSQSFTFVMENTTLHQIPEQKTKSFSFDGGLKLGYQHYFGEKQSYGVKVSTYGGIGTPADLSLKESGKDISVLFESSYLPIKAGIDLDFLWDFLERGEHTIGITLGFGYRFNYYLSLKNKNNWTTKSKDQTIIGDKGFADAYLHDFYPKIGLHYYLGHHQFELNYRFGGILSLTNGGQKDYFKSSETGGGMEESFFDTTISNTNYLSMSYTYRF